MGGVQGIMEELCAHCERPLVFPLSNPTSQCEITAEDAYRFSKGKCVFAAGAPPPNHRGEGPAELGHSWSSAQWSLK